MDSNERPDYSGESGNHAQPIIIGQAAEKPGAAAARRQASHEARPRKKLLVDRRAPPNPLEKITMLKKFVTQGGKPKSMGKDPMLDNNPLIGRLPATLMINAALVLIFIGELVFNKTSFNGRCISGALYPKLEKGSTPAMPYYVELGYGACEYNLQTAVQDRAFFGSDAADDGWPTSHVSSTVETGSVSKTDGPNIRVYTTLGALDTNKIRNYNEVFRIFWSMFMHGNLLHLVFNVFCQIQALWIIEPDWGFVRTVGLFLAGGIGGNLVSAVLDPCGTTVGSSGAMYGLYGAMVPYCIEYWNSIPRPLFLMCYNIITILVGLLMGFTAHIDNYTHMGGCIFGMMWGFATIKSVSSCDKCTVVERSLLCPLWAWACPNKIKAKLRLAVVLKKDRGNRKREADAARRNALAHGVTERRIARIEDKFGRVGAPPCRMRLREWIIRLLAISTMILLAACCTALLFDPSMYTTYRPPGQYKFSGWQTCTCCQVTQMKNLFRPQDTPQAYLDKRLFWCFSDVSAAKHFCGNDYGGPKNATRHSAQNPRTKRKAYWNPHTEPHKDC